MSSSPLADEALTTATPVRSLGSLDPAGYRVLRDVGSTYRDGGEQAVLDLVTAATDITSASDELVRASSGWAQRYHLDPTRANVIRSLDLPPGARVLEIGAGCGAITRYLGEQCAVVDALEPVPARAAAARARTRDLRGVEVLVGELADVPADPVYDLVVVVGVLEYVGHGTDRPEPYAEFLDAIAERLADGGSLILAIENKLGVKYLAGAPEDHTDRVWDSIEGYPRGGQARTFSRRELEAMIRRSGLQPTTRSAFPDYKMTRAVLGDFPAEARSLLHRVPAFPSPDWRSRRPRLGDERTIWRQLVDAGVDADFGNSLVVLAGKGGETRCWPDERLGVFFSSGRRRHLEVRTDITLVDGAVRFHRAPVSPGSLEPGVRVTSSDVPYVAGRDLVEVIADRGVQGFAEFADAWVALVDEALARDPGSVADLVPHNLVVDVDGDIRPIDTEFADYPMTREQVLRRGIYNLADRAAPLAAPERWAPATTLRDLMVGLGEYVGLPADGTWIEAMVLDEAAFYAAVRAIPNRPDGPAGWQEHSAKTLRTRVQMSLASSALGERVWDQHRRAESELAKARAETAGLRSELATDRAALRTARTAQARAERSATTLARRPEVRASRRLRRVLVELLPRGSRRGTFVRRIRRR